MPGRSAFAVGSGSPNVRVSATESTEVMARDGMRSSLFAATALRDC
ncbi:MAG: hypothetical protein QOK16_2079 [Solirubrobacteraceae bacterium]|nr:hypothetical protein [Solirubrobacteraceae bacterium]